MSARYFDLHDGFENIALTATTTRRRATTSSGGGDGGRGGGGKEKGAALDEEGEEMVLADSADSRYRTTALRAVPVLTETRVPR